MAEEHDNSKLGYLQVVKDRAAFGGRPELTNSSQAADSMSNPQIALGLHT